MKKYSQKEILVHLCKSYGTWIPSYKLIKAETQWGWLGTSADRQARLLVEEGILERRKNGKYSEYRMKVQEPVTQPLFTNVVHA